MYINFNLSSNLLCGDIEKLTAIKQKEIEWLHKYLLPIDLKRFEELNLISRIKCKKGQENSLEVLRLSDKGKKLTVELSYEGAPDEQTDVLLNWLIPIYKSKPNGIVKNKKECGRRLFWFKTVTKIEGNRLAILLGQFVSDSFIPESNKNFSEEFRNFKESNPRGVLSNMLDNICWQPDSMFDKHYTLDKSPLYRYYEDNEQFIQNIWKSKGLDDDN